MNWSLVLSLLGLAAAEADHFYRPCMKIAAKNNATKAYMKSIMTSTSAAMYAEICSNESYILTLGNCFNTAAGMMEAKDNPNNAIKWSYTYFNYICNYYGTELAYSRKEVDALLAANPITTTWDEANTKHTLPFIVDETILATTLKSAKEYYWTRRGCDVYGQALVYYIVGFFFLAAIVNMFAWVAPKQYAAVGQNKLVRPVRAFAATNLPDWLPKTPSLMGILGLFVINYILMFMGLKVTPNKYVYATRLSLITSFLGFRSGYFAMYKLPFVFFFAGRNNFLTYVTGLDADTFNAWHRWLARMVTLDVLIHFVAYAVMYKDTLAEWKEMYWVVGLVATFCYIILCIQGSRYVRALAYDIFVFAHILLSLLSVVTLYYHLHFTHQCLEIFWAMVAVWVFDRLFRLIRIKTHGTCRAQITELSPGVLQILIRRPLDRKFIGWFSGSYVYLHFAHFRFFWQSHPFTVVSCDERTLKLVVKVRKGITKKILKMVESEPQLEMSVWVDGFYGLPFNTKAFSQIVGIAGGVGITAVHAHLIKLMQPGVAAQKDITVHWGTSDDGSYCSDEISDLLSYGAKVVHHMSHSADVANTSAMSATNDTEKENAVVTEKSVSSTSSFTQAMALHTRANITEIVNTACKEATGPILFICCGPPSMHSETRMAVSHGMSQTDQFVEFYEEIYSM